MIKYTVDGGKMNRGLATVSVIETFAKKNGQKLTKKVVLPSASRPDRVAHLLSSWTRIVFKPPPLVGALNSFKPSSWSLTI
jgi:hypothetical protein